MTLENTANRTETGQTRTDKITRLAKTHQDYWQTRLKKRSYVSRNGKTAEVPTWQVRLTHLGREAWFNLDTANKAAAAVKPGMEVSKHGCTIGEFLDQVKAVSGLKPVTFEIYAKKFRSLVAGVFKIDGGKAKYDYVNGGYQEWLQRVLAVRLDRLTPENINDWKVRQLKAASKTPLKLKRASVTLRSILLSSKALFTADIRKHLTLILPSPLPFEGVTLPEAGNTRILH